MPPEEVKHYHLPLIEKRHEYGDVWSFVFEKPADLTFEPGMYAHVRLEGLPEGNRTREFSVASAPSDPALQFTVHVREESIYKQKLASLQPGETADIFKIKGLFVLPPEGQESIFIAGGIGATPFRSMLREIVNRGLPQQPLLVQVAHDEYAFEREFAAMPFEQKRIRRDDIDTTLTDLVQRHHDAHYYVAGLPGFVNTVMEKLGALAIDDGRRHQDAFDGY